MFEFVRVRRSSINFEPIITPRRAEVRKPSDSLLWPILLKFRNLEKGDWLRLRCLSPFSDYGCQSSPEFDRLRPFLVIHCVSAVISPFLRGVRVCSSLFEFDAVRKRPAYALSPAKNQERTHQSENTKTFEQKLTKETKEFGIKHLPQAAPAVLTTTCSNTIFFTSLPSFPSLQKSSLPFRCHPVAAKSGVKVRASSSDFDHFP